MLLQLRQRGISLILTVAISACSSERERDADNAARADSSMRLSTTDTMSAAGMPHDSGAAASQMPGHEGMPADHAAPGASHGTAHAMPQQQQHGGGHAVAAARHGAQHAAQAQDDTTHGMHDMKRDTAHAMHDMKPDTAHAMHDMKPDTAHAAHDMNRDTAHAGQEMHRDSSHAGAPGEHDSTHVTPGAAGTQTMDHMGDMLMKQVGPFTIMAMAQAFPAVTVALPRSTGTPLDHTGLYLTQPAIMMNISSPNERFVLRTTLNFEGITQPDGELTFGGWGEGFLDKRHPHTLLHEFMLSWNTGTAWKGFSLSAGKGFAPYGTDDPMSRPVLKYPTNHHLSQALERWTVSGVLAIRSWGFEGSVFGGQEPEGPYDLSNIESFGNSWSARATKRFGTGVMGTWPWEISASYANIAEEHHDVTSTTALYNVAVRHDHEHEGVPHYALVEYSRSDAEDGDGYFSILGEGSARLGRHQPYARVEYATRPEYERAGPRASDDFFRYDHDSHAIGSTRWLVVSGGYGLVLGTGDVSPRPFVEVQYNRVRPESGGIDPVALFGRSSFWTLSAGMRVFVGGEPMRMGTYGILDPMTAMHKMPAAHAADETSHENH
jgi:hypothetical protein